MVVCVVVACLLALTWVQNRDALSLGPWIVCFALCAASAAMLVAGRGFIPEFGPELGSVDVAIVLRFLAFGLAYQATAHFTGRKGSWVLAFAPAVLWLAASLLSLFGDDLRLRVIMGAPLVTAYSFAIAGELLLYRARLPWGAAPAACFLIFHGLFYLARFLIVLSPWTPGLRASLGDPLSSAGIMEALVIAIVVGFLLLSTAKEEVLGHYRRAALLDPLTGVNNRRGFDAEAGEMLARAARSGSATALLLLDLDHFKAVNDKWGHMAGDAALRAVAEAVVAELGEEDLLGRLGGEEFAVALPDRRIDQARRVAERIRKRIAALVIRACEVDIRLTVSIGVAGMRHTASLEALLREADAALYRAKSSGRNRVEAAQTVRVFGGTGWAQEGYEIRRVA